MLVQHQHLLLLSRNPFLGALVPDPGLILNRDPALRCQVIHRQILQVRYDHHLLEEEQGMGKRRMKTMMRRRMLGMI